MTRYSDEFKYSVIKRMMPPNNESVNSIARETGLSGGHAKKSKLVALGIPPEWASLISGSRKGYWRLSKTPQLNKALGLAF
ncbi:MAG: hypothetical protein M1119_06070 [Firmicutes bacterium]|nr:hypothetical protein [Bacillota bacterium]